MPNISGKKKAFQKPETIITDVEFDMDHIPTAIMEKFNQLDFRAKVGVMKMMVDSLKDHFETEAKKTDEYQSFLKESAAAFLHR